MMYVDAHPNMLHEGGIHDYVLPDYDHVVVPNTLMSQHYAQVLGGSRVWVIPQQNPNVHRLVKTNAADPVRVVAWQGSPENRMSAEVRVRANATLHRKCGADMTHDTTNDTTRHATRHTLRTRTRLRRGPAAIQALSSERYSSGLQARPAPARSERETRPSMTS
jgi:hypothetical protein